MNYPSFYQGDLFRSLIASEQVDLQVIFAKRLTADRLQLRWEDDLHGYPYRFIDKRERMRDAIRLAWGQRRRIHIVNGIWAEPAFAAALTTLACAGSAYAIYSEAPEPDARRSLTKRVLRTGLGRLLVARANGVLAISRLAQAFYRRLGAPAQAIYPFGYFRSRARWQTADAGANKAAVSEIIFAGQMITRKGLDLLIEALQPICNEYPDVILTLIGGGELLPELQARVAALGLGGRVFFEGSMAPENIPARLATADLLVLPSRWDGWGVVVNEAFSVGVPVIASDQCGAADIIHHKSNGYIFRSGDVTDLHACLRDFLNRKTDWLRLRANARMMGERISTEAVTPYLIECLRHMMGHRDERPVPPWSELPIAEGAD